MKKCTLISITLFLSVLMLGSNWTFAGSYPKRTIQLVYPWKAGTPGFVLNQMVTKEMGDILGRKIVTNAMPGGGGVKSARTALSKKADGYTMSDGWVANVVFGVLARKNIGYTHEDFELIGKVARMPLTLIVKGDAPWNTLDEFIAYAKENPGMSYSCSPERSVPHAVFAAFLQKAGVKAKGVPYPGIGAGVKDLLGGTIDFAVGNFPLIAIHGEKIKTLGVFLEERHPWYPEIPTMKEFDVDPGFGEAGMGWNGYMVRKDTPKDRVEILRKALKQALENEKFLAEAKQFGYMVDYQSPEAFRKLCEDSMIVLKKGLDAITWEKKQFSK